MMTAIAVLAMLGGCQQVIGYEAPTLIDGGGGASSTSGSGGSSAGCHASSPCYSGPVGTEGVGICKAGTTTCKPNGAVAACVGEVTPLVENCASGKDQNCDGTVSKCAGTLRWANRFGHAGAYAVAVDGMGATVITGSADPMANLGGGPLVNGGPVVAKYDTTGTPIFSQTVPVSDKIHSGMSAVAADLAGNTFLTGSLVGTIDFGGGPITNNAVIQEVPFLAKLGPNGAQVFSKVLELGVEAGAYALAVDGTGDIVVAGYAGASADFGGGPIGSGGGIDVFVAKFDPKGKHLASASFGGNGDARGQSVGIDATGNIVVVGAFQGTVNFGSTALTSGGAAVYITHVPAFDSTEARGEALLAEVEDLADLAGGEEGEGHAVETGDGLGRESGGDGGELHGFSATTEAGREWENKLRVRGGGSGA